MRRALSIGALLLGAIVAGLVMSEVAFRVARRFICIPATGLELWERHQDYGWIHRANASGWSRACVGRRFEWETYTTINSKGLRDREIPYERRVDTTRVLLLGDSVTEAIQVPMERSFAKLVETKLRQDGAQVEVVNAGVAEYSTDNQLLFFRAEGRRYQADLVLLVFNTDNDVMESSRELHARMYAGAEASVPPKSYFELAADGALSRDDDALARAPADEASGPVVQWFLRNLFVVRAALRALPARPAAIGSSPLPYPLNFDVYRSPMPAEWERAWRLSTALLAKLRDEVEATGARFAVAVVPGKEAVLGHWAAFQPPDGGPWDFEQPTRFVTDFLASAHIPYVDFLPFLRAHLEQTGGTGYFVFDVHLDPAGHEVVASALRPFIEQQLERRSTMLAPPRPTPNASAPP